MTAKEYLEQLFTRHDIDWLGMLSDAGNVMVIFLDRPDNIHEKIKPLEQSGDIAGFGIMHSAGSRCTVMIHLNPHKLEERTLTQSFENILRSTRDLHTRFGTTQDITKALQVLLGEVEELRAEVAAGDTEKALHESLDVFVTLISFWIALEIDDVTLVRMLDTIAGKNDAKDDTSHMLHEGVITRRGKLVR